ncbi:RNA polymerase sigma factor [Chryseobacterium sp. MMS23-Vi53]|uniref:RNA polymerase sigma factor n=1 Tax=Chryseobacterium sp. MMS23-Vi53 TaxID=3386644 RepID=UPI0039E84335
MKQSNNNIDWQKVYGEYSPKLLGICRRYIPDIYTAEDIVQDSFITAIQNNHQLKDEKALMGWLKKIVVNNALMHLRKHSKAVFVSTEPSEIPDTLYEMNPPLDEKNIFIYDFTRDQLLSSIDSLPEHHKSVFNLFFIENHSHAEISGMLGITVNTSKSHLMRAKKAVQNFLMNNFVNQDTPKNKKKAQLLVIFGLGGLLWAQTFKSKFSDFKISPSKNFTIPENISINNFSTGFSKISGQALTQKVIFGSTTLVIVAGSVFLLSPKNSLSSQNNLIVKSKLIKERQEVSTNKIQESTVEKTSEITLNKISNEKLSSENKINPQTKFTEAQINSDEKEVVKTKTAKKISQKDVVEDENETPQKVIVVKKIIKRDTIFVDK